MQTFDVAAYHVRGFLKSAESMGIDVRALLRDTRVDPRMLDDLEARFPESLVLQLWVGAERRYPGELFSLKVAAGIPFGDLEFVDYLIAASPTVGEGITALAHHSRLCASGFFYRITPVDSGEGPGMSVELDHPYGLAAFPRSIVEYSWTTVVARFRAHCFHGFHPTVRLTHSPRGAESTYQSVLGQVVFDSERDELFIPHEQWQLDNPRHDPMLIKLLEQHAQDVYARMPSSGDFIASVRSAMADALRLGDPCIERVAERLILAPRTLQRRLADCDQVYRTLLESLRRELAERYLVTTKLSLAEISHLLAYSEPSAFNRAFRRWTGWTPAEYRAAQAQSVGVACGARPLIAQARSLAPTRSSTGLLTSPRPAGPAPSHIPPSTAGSRTRRSSRSSSGAARR